jgi:2'-5' RNA ligase
MQRTGSRKTYALWLMPTGPVRRRLVRRIRALSREFSTPEFPPHITLLSGIVGAQREVLSKAARLAKRLRPFVVRLAGLDYQDEYFRCLFVRAARSRALLRAHRLAREVFELRDRRAFMPHVSLMYGHLAPRRKKQIIAALGRRMNVEFEVKSLHLFSVGGAPRAWRRVKSLRV